MELEILETKIKAGLSSKEFRDRKLLFLSHLFSLFISNDINNQQHHLHYFLFFHSRVRA